MRMTTPSLSTDVLMALFLTTDGRFVSGLLKLLLVMVLQRYFLFLDKNMFALERGSLLILRTVVGSLHAEITWEMELILTMSSDVLLDLPLTKQT